MVTVPLELQGKTGTINYKNIDQLAGFLVSEKVATLQELKTVYTFEDGLNLQEALEVRLINRYREMQRQELRSKYKR